ncbi:MAG TPA: hypothetical protein VF129_14185 [Actinomycetota bacterium]
MNVLGAASLGGNFSAGAAIGAGLVGGLAFLMVVTMGLGTGMTRMNFLPMLGSMMAPKAPRSTTYAIGFAIHMMASAVFGLVHAGILTAIDVTSVGSAAGWDLLIGAVHGVGVLILMPIVLVMAHPLVRAGDLEQPGALLTGFGRMTPMGSLLAHVAFGLVTGSIYSAIVL